MSVRRLVVGSALGLTLLPLALLLISWSYESWLMGRYRARLDELSRVSDDSIAEVGRRSQVEIRLIDARGQLRGDSHSDALASSLLGGISEELLERLHPVEPETLAKVEAGLGPIGDWPEVRSALAGETGFARRLSPSGHTMSLTLAAPRPGGGAIVLTKGSRRGMRRLLLLRDELCKLLAWELLLAVAYAILVARGLARPLEKLARSVARDPRHPVADSRILLRRDEIGQLARAIHDMAEELEARRRATAELGADVAHELKNPLATIAAAAELMNDHPAQRELASSHILSSVERLRRSIDELLALLRLEESLPGEPRQRVDYRALVQSVVEEYRHLGDWTFTLDIEPLEVELVPHRWAALLRNLIDNALVQPTARRELQITATVEEDQLITRVRDFGPGVSPGNREKLFRRFYSRRPPGAPAGTGLGLSIVQAVAAAHGGSVRLEDTDGGASFAIGLPSPLHHSSPASSEEAHPRAAL